MFQDGNDEAVQTCSLLLDDLRLTARSRRRGEKRRKRSSAGLTRRSRPKKRLLLDIYHQVIAGGFDWLPMKRSRKLRRDPSMKGRPPVGGMNPEPRFQWEIAIKIRSGQTKVDRCVYTEILDQVIATVFVLS